MDCYKRRREVPQEIDPQEFMLNVSSSTHEFYSHLTILLKQLIEELKCLHQRQDDLYRMFVENKM